MGLAFREWLILISYFKHTAMYVSLTAQEVDQVKVIL